MRRPGDSTAIQRSGRQSLLAPLDGPASPVMGDDPVDMAIGHQHRVVVDPKVATGVGR
jgi:hypothetical protein